MTERAADSTPNARTAKLRHGRSARSHRLDRQALRLVRELREDARPDRSSRRGEGGRPRPASGVQIVWEGPGRRSLRSSAETVLRRYHWWHMRALRSALGVRCLRDARRTDAATGHAERQIGPQRPAVCRHPGASGGHVSGEEVAREEAEASSLSSPEDLRLVLRRDYAARAPLLPRTRPSQNAGPVEASPLRDNGYAAADGDNARSRFHAQSVSDFRNFVNCVFRLSAMRIHRKALDNPAWLNR